MTSKSLYEKKRADAFAPYYYDDENHIDALTHDECHSKVETPLKNIMAATVRTFFVKCQIFKK